MPPVLGRQRQEHRCSSEQFELACPLLCLFPFLIVASALAGRSIADAVARHAGLSKQAAADVSQLFASSAATSNAVVGTTSMVFFVLGGIAAATALQQLYERAFGLDPRG
ncbi:MAG TPA: hypothetical protein VGQ26_25500 [Streptosporangiaceae bacterium]|jgi:membrane protein|nr:hypothetical protein [Streptosporangiaceae bacterium]